MKHKDNLIGHDVKDLTSLDWKIREQYKRADGWLPIEVYDLVQCGYPYPDHGEMILRCDSGTNEKDELLPPTGMWCKAEDVRELLREYEIIK